MRTIATDSKIPPDFQAVLLGVRNTLETGGANASLLARILRVMTAKVKQSPRSVVDSAVAQSSDADALIAFLKAMPIEAGKDHDPLLKARLRGMERMGSLLRHGGPDPLTADQVSELLRVSRQSVNTWRNERRLLGIQQARRGYLYPAWQFDLERNRIVDGVSDVLAVIDRSDPWSAVIFFTSPNVTLENRSPIDVLKRGDEGASRASVIRAASLWRQHGAA